VAPEEEEEVGPPPPPLQIVEVTSHRKFMTTNKAAAAVVVRTAPPPMRTMTFKSEREVWIVPLLQAARLRKPQLPGEPESAAAPIWSRTATMKSMTTMK